MATKGGLTVDISVNLDKRGSINAIRTAVSETRGYAEEQLRAITPVDTGLLQSNWEVTQPNYKTLKIHNPTYYAGFVEYGTRKMRAQPMATVVAPKLRKYFLQRIGYNMGKV